MVSKHIALTPEVAAIARRLEDAGHDTWCVGGAVRDFLLGVDNNDFDLATSATPDQVQKLFRRTVPLGIEHGTVAVLDRSNAAHEVTTFRKDIRTDGRHAEVEFGVRLDDDLARRDFTINAIAYHPFRREWKDPHNGREDLDAGIVRAVGEARTRFREDYLRILRCIRFATRFGFHIDQETWEAAKESASGLQHLSAERVRDEWFKSLETAKRVVELCRRWSEIGADDRWLLDLDLNDTVVLDRAGRLDRGHHDDAVFCTAYLANQAHRTLQKLRCSRSQIERVKQIGAHRSHWPDVSNVSSVRFWMSDVGPRVDDLVDVAELDDVAHGLRAVVQEIRDSGAPLSQSDLAVDGSDLLRLGMAEGPEVGDILKRLLHTVLEEPARNTKESLLRLVKEVNGEG